MNIQGGFNTYTNTGAEKAGLMQNNQCFSTETSSMNQNSSLQSTQFLLLFLQIIQQFLSLLQGNEGGGKDTPALGEPLDLSQDNLRELTNAITGDNAFAGNAPSVTQVFDTNGDGQLSVGDTAEIRRFNEQTGNYDYSTLELTQEHLDAFNGNIPIHGNPGEALPLTEAQEVAIDRVLTQGGEPQLGNTQERNIHHVLDNDGSGSISEGDTVEIHTISNLDDGSSVLQIEEHILTAEEARAINIESNNQLSLPFDVHFRAEDALGINTTNGIAGGGHHSLGAIFDADGDGMVSEGDYYRTDFSGSPFNLVPASSSYSQITAEQADAINQLLN